MDKMLLIQCKQKSFTLKMFVPNATLKSYIQKCSVTIHSVWVYMKIYLWWLLRFCGLQTENDYNKTYKHKTLLKSYPVDCMIVQQTGNRLLFWKTDNHSISRRIENRFRLILQRIFDTHPCFNAVCNKMNFFDLNFIEAVQVTEN